MKLFIWDLHGTLEQGNEDAAIVISNMALKELGYRARFTAEQARQLYGLKWYEYYEHLLPDETHERHLELQALSFKLSDDNFDMVASFMQPSDGVIEVLDTIHHSPHQQVLISNTIPTALQLYMDRLGIRPYFSDNNAFSVNAHARDTLYSKELALDSYIKDKRFDELVVIGDSGSDLRLANHARATAVLYAHPGFDFRAAGGDYRITDLRQVLKLL